MTDENAVVLSCSSCKSTHYLTVTAVTSQKASAQQMAGEGTSRDEPPGEEFLKVCVSTHHASLTLREMDVFQDLVRLRCADCRRLYELAIAVFETRYK